MWGRENIVQKCVFSETINCVRNSQNYTDKQLKRICILCDDNPQDWYEKHIETNIQPLVRLLRNNGINTTCSCAHEMYCECETYGNYYDSAKYVAELLTKKGYPHFKVEVTSGIDKTGRHYNSLTVWLPKQDGKLSKFSFHKGSN